ncbi:Ferredoxin-NADP_reductase (FNR) [Hexamita inflata]|uniref:Nucleotide-binding domain n=1 Tax=Hexamita inflata TaxID=28002 RepID=A0AA86QSV2_9EUKA|nr:Ferredoxin-NADP reductase (FNR) [Hexamita inflata]
MVYVSYQDLPPTSSNNTVKPVNHPLEAHHHNEYGYACIVLPSDCVMENQSSTIDQMSCLIIDEVNFPHKLQHIQADWINFGHLIYRNARSNKFYYATIISESTHQGAGRLLQQQSFFNGQSSKDEDIYQQGEQKHQHLLSYVNIFSQTTNTEQIHNQPNELWQLILRNSLLRICGTSTFTPQCSSYLQHLGQPSAEIHRPKRFCSPHHRQLYSMDPWHGSNRFIQQRKGSNQNLQ